MEESHVAEYENVSAIPRLNGAEQVSSGDGRWLGSGRMTATQEDASITV